jgi:sugar lactone lactonase YvrE
VHRLVTEYCILDGEHIASSTLVWHPAHSTWIRAGELEHNEVHRYDLPKVYIALFVTPSSTMELKNGMQIRDSIELCSPDAEVYYAEQLRAQEIQCI